MLLTERYKDKIKGVLSCYDRIMIHGNIRIFDYWANELRDEIRTHAEQIAKDNGLEIEFIRKLGEFRKDETLAYIRYHMKVSQTESPVFTEKGHLGGSM